LFTPRSIFPCQERNDLFNYPSERFRVARPNEGQAMTETFVTLASYYSHPEGEIARARLEAEGVKAFLTGGGSSDLFGGIQGLGGAVQLQVAESDAARATDILALIAAEGRPAPEEAERAAQDAGVWVCPLCGDGVSLDLNICPSCQTRRDAGVVTEPKRPADPREVQQEKTDRPEGITDAAPAADDAADDDLDVPALDTSLGDDLVRRAFRASVFGLLLMCLPFAIYSLCMPPLDSALSDAASRRAFGGTVLGLAALCLPFSVYAVWLLVRLGLYSGKVSPKSTPKLYGALLLGGLQALLWLLGLVGVGGALLRLFA
jgi:hypothetical protein